jgi:putative copper resistance protein D
MLEAGLTAARFLHYAGMLALFGASLFPLYTKWAGVTTPLKLVLVGAAILAAVSGLAWFAFTAANMAGDQSQIVNLALWKTVMQSTTFGPLWAVRMLLIVFAGLMSGRWPRGVAVWMLPLLSGIALALLAGTGHSQNHEGWLRVVHEVFDSAHLLAAGMWLGGLLPLGFVLAASLGRDDVQTLSNILQRFSAVAIVAVGILAASGLVNAWLLVGHPVALISTRYGQVLSAKLLLFAAMLALAAVNRFHITPRLAAGDAPPALLHWLAWNVALEQLLGLGVIAAVSVLGTLPPPAMT